MKLSILIPTIERDKVLFSALTLKLARQIQESREWVEILVDDHETDSIGTKRNRLLERASGEYLCFVDADDDVCDEYISLLMQATAHNFDCASLIGEYREDGVYYGLFEHSIKYKEWKTNPDGEHIKYIRTINHLNLIKSSIAKQFKFPETNWAEDHDWSKQLHASGLLKTEYIISETLYFYNKVNHKK